MSNVNVINTDNTVQPIITTNTVTVVTNETQVSVTTPVTNVVEVIHIGPQGPQGPAGTGGAGTTNTGSLITTASVDLNNLNTITFTKGDTSQFSITIATGSATDITALNNFSGSILTFTSSIQTQVNSLTLATSSYLQLTATQSMLQPYVLSNATQSMLQPYVLTSVTSSMLELYVLTSVTSSMLQPYVLSNATASMLQPYVLTSVTSSMIVSGALTASYYVETDPIFVAKSASLATTGSNTFKGNQNISGSVNILIPAGAAYGINENPVSNNVFWSYTPQDTNTSAVQVGWTAQVAGGGTYTVVDVQLDTPYNPFIAITLSNPSLTLGYRVGVNFSSPAKLWKFTNEGNTHFPSNVNVTGSINFNNGASVVPNLYPNGLDIISSSGSAGYVSLTSNNTQSFMFVNNDGAYVQTLGGTYQWEFRDDGYFVIPQAQSLTKQAGILSAGDIIMQADEVQSWRFYSGSGILKAPGGIEAPSFTGSFKGPLQGTASWAYSASQALTASYVNPTFLSASIAASGFGDITSVTAGNGLTGGGGSGDVTLTLDTSSFTFTNGVTNQVGSSFLRITTFNSWTGSSASRFAGTASYVTGSIFTGTNLAASASRALSSRAGGVNGQVQYNNGGEFAGNSKLTFDGTNFALYNSANTAALLTAGSSYYTKGDLLHTVYISTSYITGFAADIAGNNTGHILKATVSASVWDLVFLSSSGAWSPVTQTNNTQATQMLGICIDVSGAVGNIFIDGYIMVGNSNTVQSTLATTIDGTLSSGAPVYIKQNATNAPFLSTAVPSSGIVRILGHLIRNENTNYWFMKFRPDHTWVEI